MQHSMHIHYVVICGLPGSAVFFHIISLMAQFSKRSYCT